MFEHDGKKYAGRRTEKNEGRPERRRVELPPGQPDHRQGHGLSRQESQADRQPLHERPASGKTVLGIYEINGDTIKYCWAEPGKERPKEFATKTDSNQTLMVLKRVKEEKPESKKDKDGKDKEKDKGKEKDKSRRTRTRRRRTRISRREGLPPCLPAEPRTQRSGGSGPPRPDGRLLRFAAATAARIS